MRSRSRIPELALVLAWLVPGLGHVYAGRWTRGLVFMALLLGLFATGAHASSLECVSVRDHGVALLGQLGAGGPTLAALYLNRAAPPTREADAGASGLVVGLRRYYERGRSPYDRRTYNPYLDLGILYTALAGLLNLLVMQDAYARAGGSRSTRAPDPGAADAGPQGSA